MKKVDLLPNKVKPLGWVLFIFGIFGGIYLFLNNYEQDLMSVKVISIFNNNLLGTGKKSFFKIIDNDIFDEIVALAIVFGGFLLMFSKEKIEDEFIKKLRKDSLVWAIIVNYIILVLAIVLVYDLSFLHIMTFNMFTPLVFFVIRFNFLKILIKSHEE